MGYFYLTVPGPAVDETREGKDGALLSDHRGVPGAGQRAGKPGAGLPRGGRRSGNAGVGLPQDRPRAPFVSADSDEMIITVSNDEEIHAFGTAIGVLLGFPMLVATPVLAWVARQDPETIPSSPLSV